MNKSHKSPTAAAESMANMGNLSGVTKVLLQDTPVMHVPIILTHGCATLARTNLAMPLTT
eukprot:13517939-Ditylum_brightwellii.AAC.1